MEKSPSNAEKMKRWREQKDKKKKDADKKYYEKNRERKIAQVRDSRDQRTRPNTRKADAVLRKSQQKKNLKAIEQDGIVAEEERREKIREQTREIARSETTCVTLFHNNNLFLKSGQAIKL